MNSDTHALSGMSPDSMPSLKAGREDMGLVDRPARVNTRTMSKFAKVAISENSTVMAMMLRIIGSVMYQRRWYYAVDLRRLVELLGQSTSAPPDMIRKNGAPYHTFTRITERAHAA